VIPVAELMRELVQAVQLVERIMSPKHSSSPKSEITKVASSPCFISEVSDMYGGYADIEEIRISLLALLTVERTGAQVCALSLKDAESVEWQNLLMKVHQDEANSWKLLIECLEYL